MRELKYTIYDPDIGPIEAKMIGDGDGTFAPQTVIRAWDYYHISSSGNFTIMTASGVFGGVVVNKGNADSIFTIHDSITATGSIIAHITHGNPSSILPQYQLNYNVYCRNGLTVSVTDSDDLTILYTP